MCFFQNTVNGTSPRDYWNPLAVVKVQTLQSQILPSHRIRGQGPWSVSLYLCQVLVIFFSLEDKLDWYIGWTLFRGWTNPVVYFISDYALAVFEFLSYWDIKLWNISPLCDVAQMSDCGTLVIYFWYKPFMWRCSDVWLWHPCYLLSL